MILPKATMQLQTPTVLMGATSPIASQMATLKEEDDEVEGSETASNVLSILAFVAALAVLAFQVMAANAWVSAKDNARTGDWSLLME